MDLQQAKDLVNQAMEAYKNNDFDLAIQLWSQLEKSTDEVKEIYAKAQYNLGVVFVSLKRYQEAEQAYKNVKREDSGEGYAKAQNNLGGLLKQQQRFEESEQAYNNVSRLDSVEQYAKAQFNLGNLLSDLKRFDEAEKVYNNVSEEDSAKAYAWAQWNLYCSFGENKDYLIRIQKEHDLETYAEARFVLGELEENLDAKHECWQQIPQETEQYKQEVYQIGVVKSIAELENSKYKKELFKVFENVSKVLKALFINNKYEQSIAHYTTLSVSKLLLANKDEKTKDFEPKSKLRLNTINLMNDPEEGLLINKLLCLDSRINTQDSAFIACFTLHHDSLNQFRLYGKEGQQEATGLSLVLDKEFFSTQHNTGRIYEKDVVLSHENEKGNTAKNTLAAMPLYRCIYFDPTSGLIKVAQREEWSFKREFKLEGRHYWYSENKDAESKWNEYIGNVEEGI